MTKFKKNAIVSLEEVAATIAPLPDGVILSPAPSGAKNKLRRSIKKDLKDEYVILEEDGSIDDVTTFIPSGCSALDYIMTNRRGGGYPVGKILEISGAAAAGKSLLAIHSCAEAQKMGALCIYLDPENAFQEDFAKRVGLKMDSESFWRPDPPPPTIEALFNFLFSLSNQIDEMKKAGEWPFSFVHVVWDSVAASPCKQDVEAENPDPAANVGLKPRIISKNLTTFLGTMSKKDICLLCVNQLRNRIGAFPGQDPFITPGGNAIPFYASVRLRIKSIGKLKIDDEIVGINTEVRVEKTRFGPPFRKAIFPIYFTHGIDDPESIINTLEDKKGIRVINKGPQGKHIAFIGQSNDESIKKTEFKKMFLTDTKFKEKVMNEFEKVMTRDLSDPRLQDVEVTSD